MPPSTSEKTPASPPDRPLPGEVVRGLVSLWLIIHLLGVGLGMLTNMGMTSAGGTSALLARMKRVPILDQYIFGLWLDVGYNYPLYRDFADHDHIVSATLVYPDKPAPEDRQLLRSFPGEGDGGENLERYLAMARRTVLPVYDEMPNSNFLLANLGAALLKEHPDAKEVVLEVRRHAPLPLEDAQSHDEARHDPNDPRTYESVYTVIVTLNRSGQPQVSTPSVARDVAPVTGDAPRSTDDEPAQPRARQRRTQPTIPPPAESKPAPPSLLPNIPDFDSP